jgi:hypothetical protein
MEKKIQCVGGVKNVASFFQVEIDLMTFSKSLRRMYRLFTDTKMFCNISDCSYKELQGKRYSLSPCEIHYHSLVHRKMIYTLLYNSACFAELVTSRKVTLRYL